MNLGNRSKKTAIIGAAVLVTVYAGWVLLSNDAGQAAARAGQRASMREGQAPLVGQAAAPATSARDPAPRTPERRTRRLRDRQAREELLRLIARARARRRASTSLAPSSSGQQPATDNQGTGHLSAKYIREVIDDAIPMVQECYELGLHSAPQLAGRLKVTFTIIGEPEVGGIVESVQIPDDSPVARHPTMRECIEQTMLSLEFPRPDGGGKVKVTYPFTFRSAPDRR